MKPNLSIIIPFYKKWREFKEIWPQNAAQFSRPDVEVIVCLDEPSCEVQLLNIFKQLNLNIRVIVCREEHLWRSPAKAINVGIKHSESDYILVVSPESRLSPNAVNWFIELAGPTRAIAGYVRWWNFGDSKPQAGNRLFYGSICFPFLAAQYIGGFDECFTTWGGDDDNFRARLEMANLAIIQEPSIWVDHFHFPESYAPNRNVKHSPSKLREIYHPPYRFCEKCLPNWGLAYDETILFNRMR